MKYNKLVETHFFNPKNIYDAREFTEPHISVAVGSIELGDAITLYLACNMSTQKIHRFEYKVYGSPFLIAGLSYLSEKIMGSTLSEVEALSLSEELIKVFEIPRTKQYSAYMIEDSINKLIKNWRQKYVE